MSQRVNDGHASAPAVLMTAATAPWDDAVASMSPHLSSGLPDWWSVGCYQAEASCVVLVDACLHASGTAALARAR